MASVFEQLAIFREAEANLLAAGEEAGVVMTPRQLEVIRFLGQKAAAAPEISKRTGIPVTTVKSILSRLRRQKLVKYVDGPAKPGRPADGDSHDGAVELTVEGLRLFDRCKKPPKTSNKPVGFRNRDR